MTGNDQLGPSILSLVAVICSLRCHWKLEVCHHWRVAVRCGTAGACVGSGPCAIKGGVDCQPLSVLFGLIFVLSKLEKKSLTPNRAHRVVACSLQATRSAQALTCVLC